MNMDNLHSPKLTLCKWHGPPAPSPLPHPDGGDWRPCVAASSHRDATNDTTSPATPPLPTTGRLLCGHRQRPRCAVGLVRTPSLYASTSVRHIATLSFFAVFGLAHATCIMNRYNILNTWRFLFFFLLARCLLFAHNEANCRSVALAGVAGQQWSLHLSPALLARSASFSFDSVRVPEDRELEWIREATISDEPRNKDLGRSKPISRWSCDKAAPGLARHRACFSPFLTRLGHFMSFGGHLAPLGPLCLSTDVQPGHPGVMPTNNP